MQRAPSGRRARPHRARVRAGRRRAPRQARPVGPGRRRPAPPYLVTWSAGWRRPVAPAPITPPVVGRARPRARPRAPPPTRAKPHFYPHWPRSIWVSDFYLNFALLLFISQLRCCHSTNSLVSEPILSLCRSRSPLEPHSHSRLHCSASHCCNFFIQQPASLSSSCGRPSAFFLSVCVRASDCLI